MLTRSSAQSGASLDENNDSLADNDASLAENDDSLAEDDSLVDNDDSLDQIDPPTSTNALSRPLATSTGAPTPGSQEDEDIDELDPPTDAAPPGTSNQPGTSQTSTPARPADKPKKITGKYVVHTFSYLLHPDTVQGPILRRVEGGQPQ